ncbi:MAG: hypothetical protein LBE20_06360 [Deltaproteobacteria bacterium]|nr:hypothetical protein [Deltaproteobacteria bacterium]
MNTDNCVYKNVKEVLEKELPQHFLNLWLKLETVEKEKFLKMFAKYFKKSDLLGDYSDLDRLANLIQRNFHKHESFLHAEYANPDIKIVCKLRRRLDALSYMF